jgi:hypothetical protein
MGPTWIRVAYSALLAIVTVMTVIFGVMMAFPGPRPPDTPSLTFRQIQGVGDNQQDTDRVIGAVDNFYQGAYDFRKDYPAYQRNLLLSSVILAIIIGGIGVALSGSFNYLRLALMGAAVILLAWGASSALAPVPNPAPAGSGSITSLLAAGSPPGLDFAGRFLRFAASFVALLVFLFLGLWRLTDWAPAAARSNAVAASSPEASTASPSPGEQATWGRRENE